MNDEKLSDVDFVMQKMHVTEERAKLLIERGLNVEFMRHGMDKFMQDNFGTDSMLNKLSEMMDVSKQKFSDSSKNGD